MRCFSSARQHLHYAKIANTGQLAFKNLCKMDYLNKSDFNPKVNLEIEGVLTLQVIIDFGSQVNILPRATWVRLGRPELEKSNYYLKLVDQGLVEPLGIWKDVETSIMGIKTRINFEVIDPKQGMSSYLALVSRPWGCKMRANISLDKDRLKIKGKGKKVIIPLDPNQGWPWEETNDDDAEIRRLYQVIHHNEDTVEPNEKGEIYLGSPMSVRKKLGLWTIQLEIGKLRSISKRTLFHKRNTSQ